MLADYGFFLVLLCCIASCYGTLASIIAARLRHRRLYQSAKMAAISTGIMCIFASLILWYLLFTRDYGVEYIYKNSSNDLPLAYTLSAFWSSLEGSHFLWTLLLAIYSLIAHVTYTRDNEHIMPYVSASLQAVIAWMCYLAISYSDPFVLNFPKPENGLGMNALLQNPYMVFHPPSLFTGYTALAIPFAYSIGALCYGDITEGWLRTTRRWTLYAWTFLTLGIFLGGRWAYVELGWAGYWAWDPVENSSFMPWLFATALLHSLLVQDKLGHLKRLSIILAALAFFFSFFGTFITRSGVVSSVHSFAQSPIGPNYLAFLAALALISFGIYAWKAHSILPADTNKIWGFSKESALVVTQFLLITFAIIIFIGTVYPIVSEALTGVRFNVQAPYFNAFAPYIGFCFMVAITIGNLMRYRSGKMVGGKKLLLGAMFTAIPFSLIFCHFGDVFRSDTKPLIFQLVGIQLCFWSILCLSYDLWQRVKLLKFNAPLFLQKNLSYIGAFIAHIGFLIAVLGFLGNYRSLYKTVTLQKNEKTSLYGYEFKFSGINILREDNAKLYAAPLKVSSTENATIGTVLPARAKYPTKNELFHEVGILENFWHDIYVVLADFDQETLSRATVQIYINPTVKIVWISVVLMVLGGIVALCDRVRGKKSRDVLGVT